jgi:multidrug efflux system membrane fusion protein
MPAEESHPGAGDVVDESPDHTSPARHRRRFLIWLVVILAFVGVFWWVLRGRQTATRRAVTAPVTIMTATAAQGDMPVYLDAIGTVTPVYTNSIASQVAGQVVAVRYKEGQLVRKGDPLIDIDPRPFRATLLQAQGTLQRDTQLLAQAKMDLERYRAAWAKKAISKQQLDDQEKLVLQDEGTVKTDQGAVQFASVQLKYCHLVAPITGRVGLRLVDPGNVVAANGATTLAVITQLQPITAVFTVSEDNLSEVLEQTRYGKQLPVDLFNRTKAKQLASGKLITVDNQIDTTTGTVKLRALFDNEDNALFPNQFVNTRLLVKVLRDVTTVPSSAIQHASDATFVYVISDAHAHVQHVKTGVTDGDVTQVDGIAPGTVVANSGFEKLQEGSPVAITRQTPVPSAPSAPSARRAP